jgi:tRNA modification GTPase
VIGVRTKRGVRPPAASELVSLCSEFGTSAVAVVSAETGDGIDELVREVERAVAAGALPADADAPLLTRERHRHAVTRALEEVRAFQHAWQSDALPAPVAAVHLREAITALEDLIGAIDVEDVLDEVFRRFCVGK